MTEFLQFVGPLGEPVYVRPGRVDAIREVSLMVAGRPVRGTLVLLMSREVFKVQGGADAVVAALEAWRAEHGPEFGELVVGKTELPSPVTLSYRECRYPTEAPYGTVTLTDAKVVE